MCLYPLSDSVLVQVIALSVCVCVCVWQMVETKLKKSSVKKIIKLLPIESLPFSHAPLKMQGIHNFHTTFVLLCCFCVFLGKFIMIVF